MASFHMVDNYQGQIDTANLDTFLRSAGHTSTDLELLAIIRRMDADGDATVTFTEWADFLREIPALAKPEPLPSYLGYYGHYPSYLSRYGCWPYSTYLPSTRYSHLPYTHSYANWPSYSHYRPYYTPLSYSHRVAPRYTHTTYEPAGTTTDYVPRTVTTYEPVTTYSTKVIPSYRYITEKTEYVTSPVRTTVSTAAHSLYGSPFHSQYCSPYSWRSSYLW
jgi:hypothetical protein